MKHKYICIEQRLYHKDIGAYTTYGIKHEGDPEIIADDVSCDEQIVRELTDDLNEFQAEPIHLYDIIEDRLALH